MTPADYPPATWLATRRYCSWSIDPTDAAGTCDARPARPISVRITCGAIRVFAACGHSHNLSSLHLVEMEESGSVNGLHPYGVRVRVLWWHISRHSTIGIALQPLIDDYRGLGIFDCYRAKLARSPVMLGTAVFASLFEGRHLGSESG